MGKAVTGSASVGSAVDGMHEIGVLLLIGVIALRHSELVATLATPSEAALNGPSRVHDHVAHGLSAIATLSTSRREAP